MFLRKIFPDNIIIDLNSIDTIHGGEEYQYFVGPNGDFTGQSYTRYYAAKANPDSEAWIVFREDCAFDMALQTNSEPVGRPCDFSSNIVRAASYLARVREAQIHDTAGFCNRISGKRYYEGSHDSPPLKKCWDAALRKPALLTSGREAHLRDVLYTMRHHGLMAPADKKACLKHHSPKIY